MGSLCWCGQPADVTHFHYSNDTTGIVPGPPPATPDPVAALRIAAEALIRCSALLCHRVADGDRKDDCGTCPPCGARAALTSIRKLAPPDTEGG